MSKITSPILLDTTGQDINETLKGIKEVLLSQNTLIDDTTTAADRVWSSKKITEALTIKKTFSGSTVICEPIAATPIIVESTVEIGDLLLTQTNGTNTIERRIYVPAAGRYNWTTGLLVLEDGNRTHLSAHSIKALSGINTFTISNGSMDVTCRIIGTSSGETPETPTWDVIYGGGAAEEA